MKKTIYTLVFSAIVSLTNAQWVQMPNGIGTNKYISSFILSGNNIFAAGPQGELYLSTNYGTNWVLANIGIPAAAYINDLEVKDSKIFAATNTSAVYVSTNNGSNWILANYGIPDPQTLTLASNPTYLYAGCYDYGLYRTTNNGLNWTNCLNTFRTYGLYANGNNIFVGTHYSGAFRSTNSGDSWTQINNGLPGAGVMITSFVFNGVNLFTAARDIGIYRSSNFGDSWQQVNNGITNFVWNTFESSGINVFVGAQAGGVYLSTNNGNNWLAINQGFGSGPAINRLYIVNNYIFAGTNGHSAWRRHLGDVLIPAVPAPVSPANNANNVPVNLNLTWNRSQFAISYHVQLATDSLFNNLTINDSLSTDTIKTVTGLTNNTNYWWRVRAKSPAGISNYSAIFKFTTVIAVPSAPVLVSPPNNSNGQSLTPLVNWDSVLNASTFRVQISTDSSFNSNVYDTILSISQVIVPAGRLSNNVKYFWKVCASNSGGNSPWSVIWNFTTALVGISQSGNEIPKEYKLYNNYPNPFNPVTKIKFDIPLLIGADGRSVLLTIFDILGREVAILVNEQLKPGTYEADWNASSYPSGVYFYTMRTEGYTQTKRMVLIK